MTRANSAVTKEQELLELMQRIPLSACWGDEHLARALSTSVRSIERWKQSLKETGRLPIRPQVGGFSATTQDGPELHYESPTLRYRRAR